MWTASRPLGLSLRCVSRRSMYTNPYVAEHQRKRQVSADFPKKTTGLTGLFVNEHPHRTLTIAYGRILRSLQQMPASSAYRQSTEKIVKERLDFVEKEPDIEKLEKLIGMGQIEEVIQQAEDEVQTARALVESRAWEPLLEPAKEAQWRWPPV